MSNHGTILRGVTLIEMLVVIVVLLIVVAITLPVLRSASSQRGVSATLARLDQSAKIIFLYSHDHREHVPTVFGVGVGPWKVRLASGWEDSFSRYFFAGRVWQLAATDAYLDGTTRPETIFAAKRNGEGRLSGSPFHIPCVFFAKPAYWNASTRMLTYEQLGPSLLSQVLYPSSKSLLVSVAHTTTRPGPEINPPYRSDDPLPGKVPVAKADGSAVILAPAEILGGMSSGEGKHHQAMHPFDYSFGLHTLDGVRGRDVR